MGETLSLPGGASAEILAPYATGHRLWLTRLTLTAPLQTYLRRRGRPIAFAGIVPQNSDSK